MCQTMPVGDAEYIKFEHKRHNCPCDNKIAYRPDDYVRVSVKKICNLFHFKIIIDSIAILSI